MRCLELMLPNGVPNFRLENSLEMVNFTLISTIVYKIIQQFLSILAISINLQSFIFGN